jgi:hypothetical protein
MHVTSHAFWTSLLARRVGARHAGWAALGAALPDLPAAGLTVGLVVAGRTPRVAGDEVFAPRFEPVHRAVHSALVPAALAIAARAASRGSAFALGWLGHLAVDLVSHHSDARPLAWPLSMAVWRSPVSHWEADHGAAAWNAVDAAALVVTAIRESRPGARLAAIGAAAVAAAGLVEALRGRPGGV